MKINLNSSTDRIKDLDEGRYIEGWLFADIYGIKQNMRTCVNLTVQKNHTDSKRKKKKE